jgi:hypothetical protein
MSISILNYNIMCLTDRMKRLLCLLHSGFYMIQQIHKFHGFCKGLYNNIEHIIEGSKPTEEVIEFELQ